jgi:peptide/nickel transport system substrate-binding protein
LILLAAFSIVAAACGDDDDDDGGDAADTTSEVTSATTAGTTGGTQAAPSPTAATTASTAPVEDFDPEGVIRYGANLSGSGTSGRLLPAVSTSVCDFGMMDPIYSTIVHRNGTNGNLEPELAEEWEAPDAQTFRFTLRDGLTFHDGTPLDAEAAVAGLEAIRGGGTASVAAAFAAVESITAVDDLTVEIKFTAPVAGTFAYTLAGREGMIAAASSTDAVPVGAGPFKFVSQTPNALYTYEKNPDYWNAEAVNLAGIEYVHVESGPSTANALLAGDIDIFLGDPTVNEPLVDNDDFEIPKQPGSSYHKLSLKLDDPQLSILEVRQAINHGIDREALVETVWLGDAEPGWQPYNSTFFGHNPEANELYPYDPERARELLAEAGFPDGITVQMFKPANVPSFQRIADLIVPSLAEAGITLEFQDSTDMVREYLTEHLRPGALTLWPVRPDPSVTMFNQWTLGPPLPPQNTGSYSNPVIDEGVATVRGTSDPEVQEEAYKEMSLFVAENALDVPLAFPALSAPHSVDVLGDVEQYENCQFVNFRNLAKAA